MSPFHNYLWTYDDDDGKCGMSKVDIILLLLHETTNEIVEEDNKVTLSLSSVFSSSSSSSQSHSSAVAITEGSFFGSSGYVFGKPKK